MTTTTTSPNLPFPSRSRFHFGHGIFSACCRTALAAILSSAVVARAAEPAPASPPPAAPAPTTPTGPVAPSATPAPGTTSTATSGEEVIELSPFTVNSERDVGYVATNTLGGSRLNTALKDTAASISVLTSEFLSDVGALDVESALAYTPNLQNELSEEGPAGNRLLEFHTTYRVRGVRATSARNYFVWTLPTNLYNIERIDQSRGPNSILFGIGSAGGIVNSSTKQPVLGRRFTTVGLYGGSYDSWQATLDVNQPLAGGKAGIRFNAVREDEKTHRFYEFSQTQAAHLSGKWQILPKTTLRTEGELGYLEDIKNRPWTLNDQLSIWDNAGRPTPAVRAANAGLGINLFPANTTRVTLIENDDSFFDVRGSMRSNVPAPNAQLVLPRNMADYTVSPEGRGAVRTTDFYTYTFAFEQRIGDDTFLELAFNRQDYDFISYDPLQAAHVLVGDPNLTRPTGLGGAQQTNPYAARLFLESNWFRRTRSEAINNLRLTGSTAFDAGKWGRYRLALLGERQTNEFQNDAKREVFVGAPFGGDFDDARNNVFRRTYVDEFDWSSYRVSGGKGQLISNKVDSVSGRTLSSDWIRNANVNDDPSELDSVLAGLEARYFDERLVAIGGVRRDWLHNEDRGVYKDLVAGSHFVDYDNVDVSDFTYNTTSFGLVGHVRPWLSLHYNQSTNSSLPNIIHRILPDNGRAPGAKGKGKDVGFSVNLPNNRLSFKATYYETDSRDETDFRTVGALVGPAGVNDRVLDGLRAANLITAAEEAVHRVEANTTKFTRAGDGFEFELVANPTNRWRVSANYTLSHLIESNVGDEVVAFVEDQIAFWQRFPLSTPTVQGATASTIAEDIVDARAALATLTATNGTGAIGNREHKVALVTRYTFDSGLLRNFFAGGAFRYQSGRLAGAGPSGELLHSNSLTVFDAFLGWRKRLFQNRTTLNLQLNVRNLLDFDTPQATIISPTGRWERFDQIPPRSFQVSAKLEF